MTVARTTLLDLPIITTGTESGLWGDYTNNGLTQYLDIAIAGMSNLTSANFTAGALTIEATEGTNSATNIVATSAQYAGFRVSSLATNSTITVGNTGTTLGRSYRLINADSTYTLTFKATGQTGVTLQPGQSATVAFNGTDYVFVGVVLGAAQTFTAAQTFRAANAIRSEAANTQDAVVVAGRAGGTNSYAVTITPTTLSANRTLTIPDASGTILQSGTAVTVAQGGTGLSTTTAYGLIAAGTTSTGNFQQVSGTGTSGQVLTSNGAGALPTWQAGASGNVTTSGNNAFTGANTFYNATGQTFAQASTNDGIILQGRAGGTSSYRVTFTTGTLSASRTVTLPDANTTIPVATQVITFSGPTAARTYTLPDSTSTLAALATAQTFTAAQTFQAANAIRSEAASTQDAVVIAGRAGGTSSYAVTLTPTALSANRTLTLPDADINFTTGLGVAQGGTGLTTLTANNVILGNGTSTPLFVAPGTSGNVLKSNGTTWTSAAISTGGLTLLATLSPSGVTSISATSLTSSKAMFIVVDLSETGAGYALAELSVNNGSSYSATQHPLSATNSNSGQRGNAWISNMNINAKKISDSLGQSTTTGVFCQQNALAEGDATVNAGTVNAIRFKNSNGTNMNGNIYIYGLT